MTACNCHQIFFSIPKKRNYTKCFIIHKYIFFLSRFFSHSSFCGHLYWKSLSTRHVLAFYLIPVGRILLLKQEKKNKLKESKRFLFFLFCFIICFVYDAFVILKSRSGGFALLLVTCRFLVTKLFLVNAQKREWVNKKRKGFY